jgi:hypothetical protein
LNFSFTDCGGSFAPTLTARKFGTIHKILLVCRPSSGFAAVAEVDELGGSEGLCCPSGTGEGVGASGIAVAASSVCWVTGGGSEVPPACAKAGVSGKRQSAKVISNRIKVAALIKSIFVEYPRSISVRAWLFDYEINRTSAARND